MRRFPRRTLLALGGAAALAIPTGAWAAGSAGAVPSLTGPVSGRLVGTSGGAFAMYQFAYPGDGSTVTLTLTTDTSAALANGAAGINVYQHGARLAASSQSGPFAATATFASTMGGSVIVQVYTYTPGIPITYTLSAQGLPTQTMMTTSSTTRSIATSTSSSMAVGATAAGRPLPLAGPVSGQLVGKSSGAFARYQFTQTGTGSPITFLLTTDNARPLNSGAAGVEIYQNGNLLTTSSPSGPFQQTAIITPTQGGAIVVQVFNYDPTQTIAFTLTPQGLPAQPFVSPPTTASTTTAVATGTTTSGTSTARTAPTPLAGQTKGLLAGLNGGSFAYYSLPLAGNGRPITLTLTVYPPVEVANGAAGLNVYDPDGRLAATATPGATPGVAVAQVSSTSAGTATIQVFNYDPRTTIIYTLAPGGG